MSNTSADLVRFELPAGVTLRDMKEHRLKGLLNLEHLWQVVAPDLTKDFPPLLTLNSVPNNLPIQLTSFIGREKEIAEVKQSLMTTRLLTLTGSGGTGKTRLALQVVAIMLDNFKDGVWFIGLAPLTDPGLIPISVAKVLGVHEEPGGPLLETLIDWMGNRELLLILDNCEHLLQACAQFADSALHTSPGLHILASSREALGIGGETVYHVPSLETPNPRDQISIEKLTQYESVRLFNERAAHAHASFSMTPTNAPAIVQICHRLDGIPLALELAAARVKALHVEQIADRLDDRFRLLTGGSRTALPRHQTLHSLIDWSHSLLSESERILFRRLSVFAGGWTLEAAEQVCAGNGLDPNDGLDLLTHLVDKSLVILYEGVEESRYRMLETIRQYAREKAVESGEGERLRDSHLNFMLALTQKAETRIHGHEEAVWHDRLEMEIDNLRAALEWALSLDDAEAGLQLAGSAYWFWWTRGHSLEAHGWLKDALAMSGAGKRTKGRAKALIAMGWLLSTSGDYAEAQSLLEESVSIARAIGDKRSLLDSLSWLGWAVASLGEYSAASPILEENLALGRKLGDKFGIGMSLLGFGELKISQGNYTEAQASYQESSELFRAIGDKNVLASNVRWLGQLALRQTDYRKAFDLCVESMTLNQEIGDKRGVAASLAAIGSIMVTRGHAANAARLYGAAFALLESFGGQFMPADQVENEPYMISLRSATSEDEYNKAFSEGQAMKMEQAMAYALEAPRE